MSAKFLITNSNVATKEEEYRKQMLLPDRVMFMKKDAADNQIHEIQTSPTPPPRVK